MDGVGVTGVTENGDGTFTINFTDGTQFTTIDLTGPAGDPATDDQQFTQFEIDPVTNELTINIENATAQTVDLTPYLDNTDDQQITDFTIDPTTNILTITLEDGGTQMVDLSGLNNAGSDDQLLSLSGDILTLEDGGTVDLTPYLDNTDDQQITDFTIDPATNVLTITLEDGGTQMVDLSGLNNAGSDDQLLSLSGDILTLEAVSYTHLRAHETVLDLVCRLLLE